MGGFRASLWVRSDDNVLQDLHAGRLGALELPDADGTVGPACSLLGHVSAGISWSLWTRPTSIEPSGDQVASLTAFLWPGKSWTLRGSLTSTTLTMSSLLGSQMISHLSRARDARQTHSDATAILRPLGSNRALLTGKLQRVTSSTNSFVSCLCKATTPDSLAEARYSDCRTDGQVASIRTRSPSPASLRERASERRGDLQK